MAAFVTITWILIAPLIAAGLTASQIVIWLTLVPYLFLPERFAINLSGLPDIDKTAAITLGLLLCFLLHREKFRAVPRPAKRTWAVKFWMVSLFGLMIAGALLTLLTNREPLVYGPTVLPGMRLWDSISLLSGIAFYVMPFFFAWRYLSTPKAHRDLLTAFVVTGLIYSVLMLIEIRLSPQLHTWVYGYFQHSFLQHVRDGFRPIVFLQHGIWVGFFIFMTVLAAIAMWKSTKESKWLMAAVWLFLILGVSKNAGAAFICILCSGVLLLAPIRIQKVLAASVAVAVLVYPALRQVELIPTAKLTSFAASVSVERAQSLQFRLDNEDQLLARAYLKPLAGWGGYNREKILSERGEVVSVPDGLWIITIGTRGWLGYIALFGILTSPIILFWLSRHRSQAPPETLGLTLIIAGNLIYMIPNATLTAIGWLVFGALAGYLRYQGAQDAVGSSQQTSPSTRQAVVYTRFGSERT